MKKQLLLLAAGLLIVVGLQAQEVTGTCGFTAEDGVMLTDRLQANIRNSGKVATDRGAVQYVPIHFHLTADNSGTGRIKESKVLDQLCALNEQYAPMDIRFYLSPHPTIGTLIDNTINSNNVYNNQSSWFTMTSKRHNKAINVFVVDVCDGTSDNNEVLGYYSIPRDWLVMKKNQVHRNGKLTLPHEAGHFFSLLHTFNGWESNPFDATDTGWPVAHVLSPDGVPTEKENGSNCTTAGDYLCDTPPDYLLGFGFSGCDYNLGAKDPTGTVIDPMETNMMGYFLDCSDHVFTTEQQNAILADLASSDRNYLDNTFTPAATEINTPADLLTSPADAQTTPYFDQVLLEWNPVAGATYYLVEVDFIFAYNSPSAQSWIVNGTSKLITGLQANKTYYWRVRPFNEYVTCATARQRSFKTSSTSAIRDIEGLNAWQIAPNPVQTGNATIFVNANDQFDANIRIFDIAGRQISELTGIHFSSGDTTVDLHLNDLKNGLYFVMLQNGESQSVRKITVVR